MQEMELTASNFWKFLWRVGAWAGSVASCKCLDASVFHITDLLDVVILWQIYLRPLQIPIAISNNDVNTADFTDIQKIITLSPALPNFRKLISG